MLVLSNHNKLNVKRRSSFISSSAVPHIESTQTNKNGLTLLPHRWQRGWLGSRCLYFLVSEPLTLPLTWPTDSAPLWLEGWEQCWPVDTQRLVYFCVFMLIPVVYKTGRRFHLSVLSRIFRRSWHVSFHWAAYAVPEWRDDKENEHLRLCNTVPKIICITCFIDSIWFFAIIIT